MKTRTTRSLTFFLFFSFILWLSLSLASSSSSPVEDSKPGGIVKDTGLSGIQSVGRADAVLLVTGSTRGEFEPCGCGGVFEGGFARRSTLIHQVREVNPKTILLDTGDTLSNDSASLTEFVFQAYGRLGYDAIGLGEGDLRAGLEVFGRYAKKYNLPFVASNVKFKTTACVREVIEIERAGHKVAIISMVADGWLAVLPTDLRNQLTYESPAAALERLVPRLHKTCDTIILISHFGTKVRQTLVGKMNGIDLWIDNGGHQRSVTSQPGNLPPPMTASTKPSREESFFPNQNPPLFISWQNDRKVGIAGIKWQNHKITVPTCEMIPLVKGMTEDKAFLDIYDAYKYASRQEMIKKLMGSLQQTSGTRPAGFQYVSSEKCAPCHQDIYEFWKTTKHARAFTTLKKGNRDSDINCWACHTTGYREEGGFDTPVTTPSLVDVGCQDCHKKNLRDHPRKDQTTATQTIPVQAFKGNLTKSWHCERCHVPHRSPKYEYQSYVKRIACPQAVKKEKEPTVKTK